MRISTTEIILPILILLFLNFLDLNAQSSDIGKVIFGYNKKPDSIYVDGKKKDMLTKYAMDIEEGEHKIEAFLSCYNTIEKNIEIKPNRVHPVRLKFKHLTTQEYDSYKSIRMQNYVMSILATGTGVLFKGGVTSLIPVGALGFTGQIFWQLKQSSYLNHCNGEYNNPHLKNSRNKIIFGINSRIGGEYSVKESDSFSETYQTPYAKIRLERYLKKKIIIHPNNKNISSYSIFLAYQRQFGKRYNVSAYSNLYPKFTYRAELYDVSSLNYDFGDPKHKKEYEGLLLLMGLDFDYKMINRHNYTLYFSIGGFVTNTISEKIGFEVVHPDLNYFDENPPLTYLNFSYSASGGSAGVVMDYLITNNLSFNTMYKVYFAQFLELNSIQNQNILFNVAANLVYNF